MSFVSKFSDDSGCGDVCSASSSRDQCEVLTGEQIHKKLANAVVKINSEFILVGVDNTGDVTQPLVVDDTTPLSPPTLVPGSEPQRYTGGRIDTILPSNGFFIQAHYILAPASAVLLPPTLTAAVNRYPYAQATDYDATLGRYKNEMVRASRILVTVFDVNGSGLSYVYEADLVGVDGAGDLAVLKINPRAGYNQFNPMIEKCHPFFEFGNSRALRVGEKVYMIGDYLQNNSQNLTPLVSYSGVNLGLVEGTVTDYRNADHSGWALQELVLVNANINKGARGMPILNQYGKVVGLQTLNPSSIRDFYSNTSSNSSVRVTTTEELSYAGGPSEYWLRKPLEELIKGICSGSHCTEKICDILGSYQRFTKGYAGLATDVFDGYMYDITNDYSSGFIASSPKFFPRIRLDSEGNLTDTPTCKEIIGVRVIGIAGANPNNQLFTEIPDGHIFVPGGNTNPSLFNQDLPVSPFFKQIHAGDLITHIDGYALGDLGKQIPPAVFTWNISESDNLNLTVRRGGNVAVDDSNTNEDYENLKLYRSCAAAFPAFLDYPWYAITMFPNYRLFFDAYAPTLVNRFQLPGDDQYGLIRFHPSW